MKYLIPPRLNQKYMIFGFTVPELAIILVTLLVAIFARSLFLFAVPAAVLVSSARFIDADLTTFSGGINARDYVRLIYRFYWKPQDFNLLGGEGNG